MLCRFAFCFGGIKIVNNKSNLISTLYKKNIRNFHLNGLHKNCIRRVVFDGLTIHNVHFGSFNMTYNAFLCNNKKSKKKIKKSKLSKRQEMSKTNEKTNVQKLINENICKGKKNLAAVLYTKKMLRLEEREKPKPCPGEVVIAMNCVGLNNSDATYYKNGLKGLPLVLGCDGTGIVAELGKGVRKLREGDRVVIEPKVSCDRCAHCRLCQRHLCPYMRTFGNEPYDGLLTCYHAHNADYCHKLGDNLTMEEGVLIGTLAVGVTVCQQCPLCPESPYLIIGAGLTGLAILLAAKATGAANICLLCKVKERLNFARQFHIKTVRIPDGVQDEDIAQTVREVLGGAPIIAVDTVGTESSMKLAIASVAAGGKIFLANATETEANLPLKEIATRDLTIRSALNNCNKYPAALALTNSCAVNLKPLISHHFYFEEITKAMDTLVDVNSLVNQVIVHIRPRDRNNPEPF